MQVLTVLYVCRCSSQQRALQTNPAGATLIAKPAQAKIVVKLQVPAFTEQVDAVHVVKLCWFCVLQEQVPAADAAQDKKKSNIVTSWGQAAGQKALLSAAGSSKAAAATGEQQCNCFQAYQCVLSKFETLLPYALYVLQQQQLGQQQQQQVHNQQEQQLVQLDLLRQQHQCARV